MLSHDTLCPISYQQGGYPCTQICEHHVPEFHFEDRPPGVTSGTNISQVLSRENIAHLESLGIFFFPSSKR